MEHNIADTTLTFQDFVNRCELNTTYDLPDNCMFEWLRIERGNEYDSGEVYFSWTMEWNYKVSGMVSYVFPMANGNYVKHFKTEAGAKRNLINKYSESLSKHFS